MGEKNKTFARMSGEINEALQSLRDFREDEAKLETDLRTVRTHRQEAEEKLEGLVKALHEAHPELSAALPERIGVPSFNGVRVDRTDPTYCIKGKKMLEHNGQPCEPGCDY